MEKLFERGTLNEKGGLHIKFLKRGDYMKRGDYDYKGGLGNLDETMQSRQTSRGQIKDRGHGEAVQTTCDNGGSARLGGTEDRQNVPGSDRWCKSNGSDWDSAGTCRDRRQADRRRQEQTRRGAERQWKGRPTLSGAAIQWQGHANSDRAHTDHNMGRQTVSGQRDSDRVRQTVTASDTQ